MTPTGERYRPEIDGLRAVAILCVVFFHLKVPGFGGGYVGVDIFFVISGYLITRNIVDDLVAGTFSLSRFYARRIRRLFPALLFTVAATFVAAALWFPPDALRAEARDTLVTLASLSNVHFWRQAHGYFSPQATTVPLLHTWSLSVEEQFYVVWSIALLAIATLHWRKLVPFLILVAGLLSLAASQYWLARDSVAAFYFMPFRIFELSIGALCIWAERWRAPNVALTDLLFAAGLVAIAASFVLFDAATPFPGVNALLPCLGAAAVIYSGTRARLAVVLNNQAAVGVGLISYSLYLCHWPILVFIKYIFGEPEQAGVILALIALCFVTATGMYFFIEKPFRFHSAPVTPRSFARLLVWCAALSAPFVALAVLTFPNREGAWAWRLTDGQKERVRLQSFGYLPCPLVFETCAFGEPAGPLAVMIIGDSFAQHLVAAFQPYLKARGLRGQVYAAGGCSFIEGERTRRDANCELQRRAALTSAASNSVPLVISQAWLGYPDLLPDDRQDYAVPRHALERTIERYGGTGRHFLIVGLQVSHDCRIEQFRLEPGPLPHWMQPPCADYPRDRVFAANAPFNQMLKEFQNSHADKVSLLLPSDYLCDTACPLIRNGIWYYRDFTHLTVAGAEYFGGRARAPTEKPLTGAGV
ncbi:MAG: acyltransferase family protein [Pseudolabrys sp.]